MFKIITDYPNYTIDDQGQVYNHKTNKLLQGSIGENGYKYYRLSKNGTKKMFYAHRLVAEYFLDNPNGLPIVDHIDGNKLNNNVNNLRWSSYSDNTKSWYENKDVKKIVAREKYTGDLSQETWLPVPGFTTYLVSSCGRVRNIKTNNILHPSITCGYYKIRCSENGYTKDFMVHKLVYSVFYQDTDFTDDTVIDHIDGNKLNNNMINLRKLSLSDNVTAALYITKTNKSAKPVQQYDLNNNLLNTFPSAREAARQLNLDSSTITKVCRGKNKTHGGFIFKFLNE